MSDEEELARMGDVSGTGEVLLDFGDEFQELGLNH